jgi:hypothetical protein
MGSGSALRWESGHEYVYSYNGRLLTGIPELNEHHFSGLGIKCEISLQVKSENMLVLSIRDPKYTRVNEAMQPNTGDQRGSNWRFLQMPSYTSVPSESRRLLEKPTAFEVSASSGKVESIRVSSEEPEWSVNFKKALISLLQTGGVERPEIRRPVSASQVLVSCCAKSRNSYP